MLDITILLRQCITTLLVFDYPEFQEFLLNTLQSRMFGMKAVGAKVDFWEKCTWSYLHDGLSI